MYIKLGLGDLALCLDDLTPALVSNILALPILASSVSIKTMGSKLDFIVYWVYRIEVLMQ